MPKSRRVPRDDSVADDYPVRPRSDMKDEQISSRTATGQLRTLILFCFVYFLYGSGISIYGPLFPREAKKNEVDSRIYGSVIATSHFVCILVYPIICRMVSSVSCRHSLSMSLFMIGACRILFGTLVLMSETLPFIAISFSIQAVEGIGMSILMASTVIATSSHTREQMQKIYIAIQASLSLGLAIGPIAGKAVKEALDFDAPFYIIGVLTIISLIFTATLLPEPNPQITYEDVPVIFWTKDKRMIVYFLIVFATFNYVGFISVALEHLLKQFHLKILYVGLMFSISPFAYGLTSFGWTWLIRKGFNSVMMIFLGSILTFSSLVLLGPAPFVTFEASLIKVSSALLLQGLGIACKSASVIESSERDLRHRKKFKEIQQQLIIPTIFIFGCSLGYFTGSLTAGFTDFYIGYRKGTLILFALEIFVAITSVIFAFTRNYVSKRRMGTIEETQEILRT